MRHRLDEELVSQGFFSTRAEAERAVMAGDVSTTNRRLDHPGEQVRTGIELHIRRNASYVSRGGIKLAGALEEFGCSPEGLVCLDVGCSTGGFTDCLLKHGAARVTAVDVGYAQFDFALRQDARVELLERTNVRDLDVEEHKARFDLIVCDVSFTPVSGLLRVFAHVLRPGGFVIVLVKPQFECEALQVGEGGIVRDPRARLWALERVALSAQELGMSVCGVCTSPIRGAKGNEEYFMLMRFKGTGGMEDAGDAPTRGIRDGGVAGDSDLLASPGVDVAHVITGLHVVTGLQDLSDEPSEL